MCVTFCKTEEEGEVGQLIFCEIIIVKKKGKTIKCGSVSEILSLTGEAVRVEVTLFPCWTQERT